MIPMEDLKQRDLSGNMYVNYHDCYHVDGFTVYT